MKNNYDIEVKKILKNAEKEMFGLNHPYVGSEHMLLAVLNSNNNVSRILNNNDLYYDDFKNELIKIIGKSHRKSEIALYTPLLKRILVNSSEDANENNNGVVKTSHLILSLLEEGEGIAIRILINMGIDLDKVYGDISKLNNKKPVKEKLLVYQIGKLLNNKKADKILKRDNEIDCIIEVLLRKNKNNPLLIGEAGVGKTAIVEELARRIECNKVPECLSKYKIIELDTGSLISGTRYRGDFEERLTTIIEEIINEKDIILFIDEIHTLINCGGAEGAIDAANILKPYLARNDIKLIGATTNKEYKNSILKDKALERRFQKIIINEPNLKETEFILNGIKANYEKYHNLVISEENIRDIVNYSDKYIFNKYNPDKSIDVLDSVCAHVKLTRPNSKNALLELNAKKEKFLKLKKYKDVLETELEIKHLIENTDKIQISKKDILKIIEYKANMPVLDTFNDKLKNLNKTMKEHIYGHDQEIDNIVEAIKEKYLVDNRKPLSILIKGPSGVGKTYTANEIANILFGNNHFLRLDMSEFNNEFAITKLLGATAGYVGYEDDCLLNKIKDYPYSIILLDEIEKSSKKVQNLFLQILDNGTIKNGKGENIYFNNTTIIMTSNISISNPIGFNKSTKKNEEENLYSKIDKIIEYGKISINDAKKFIKREKGTMELTKDEIKNIILNSNLDKYGMRGIQKELNKYKINKLIVKI